MTATVIFIGLVLLVIGIGLLIEYKARQPKGIKPIPHPIEIDNTIFGESEAWRNPNFGLCKENPIPTGYLGFDGMVARMRTIEGRPLKLISRGSFFVHSIKVEVNKYYVDYENYSHIELYFYNGDHPYISPYEHAPKGFKYYTPEQLKTLKYFNETKPQVKKTSVRKGTPLKTCHYWFQLAEESYKKQEFTNAVLLINKAIEYEQNEKYYFKRAIYKERKKDLGGAVEDYTRALEIKPDKISYRINRGLIYEQLGKMDLAISDWVIAKNAGSKKAASLILKYIKTREVRLPKVFKENIKTIFKSDANLSLKSINHLGMYHPKRKGTNPNFNSFSQLILDLKERDQDAIDDLYFRCEKWLDGNFDTITIVPSHDPEKRNSGVRTLAYKLAKTNGWIDGTACLSRRRKIDKLSYGGNRDIDVHLSSIKVLEIEKIKNKIVLVLDDVSTSGNSLHASRQILLDAGAASVCMCVLGKTSSY